MDWLDRLMEQNDEFTEGTIAVMQVQDKKTQHNITIIGCIKGVDGWYRAGFDEDAKTIIPLEKIHDKLS